MIKILSIAALVILIAASCEPSANAYKNSEKTDNHPAQSIKTDSVELGRLVTFIELGSKTCIPCQQMQPIMKDIEKEYPNDVKVLFFDVNVPSEREVAMKYGIRVIPTQIFLDSEGKEFFRHEGYFPKEELVKVLKEKGAEN